MPDLTMTVRSLRQVSSVRTSGESHLRLVCVMSRDDMKSILRGIQSVVSGSEWDRMLKEVDEEE